LLLVGGGVISCARGKDRLASTRAVFVRFQTLLERLPASQRTVVFVRYAPTHDPTRSFVRNPSDFTTARHWIVHDRGDDNRALLALAPSRVPYLFDEDSFRLLPLSTVSAGESGRP
jgi:hypothetical protein